jgi:hypothetical protein
VGIPASGTLVAEREDVEDIVRAVRKIAKNAGELS